jgi:itaconate CoA-transferase
VQTPGGLAQIVAPPVIWDEGPRELGPVPAIGEQSARIRMDFAA